MSGRMSRNVTAEPGVYPEEAFDPAPRYTSQDELGLLGSMILKPERIPEANRLVGSGDFGDVACRAVFNAIGEVHKHCENSTEALIRLVIERLKASPLIGDPQGLLLDIYNSVSTAAHVESFARAVRDAALKRRLYAIATDTAKAASNGRAGSEVLADLLADVEDLQRSAERREMVEKFTLGELVTTFPRMKPPVVDGLFRQGETVNVIAASKVGKSWLGYGLALSIINNERWLGRFDVSPGKVLLIDNELHCETLASRIPAVAEAMGIPLDTVDRDLIVWPLRGNLKSLQELGAEFDRIEPGEFKAIILDAKYRFATEGVSENDNAAETLVYNLLDQYAAKTEAAIVVIHHASKGSQVGKEVTDVGSGAGAQSRATDCHVVIRPHEEEGCAVLEAAVRSFAPVAPLTLRWAFPLWIVDGDLDPTKLKGRLGKGQQAKAAEDAADKQRILDSLAEASEPLSIRKLRQATGFGKDKAERLVFSLISDGMVAEDHGIVSNNKCSVYTLTETGGLGGTSDSVPPTVPPGEAVPGGGGVGGSKEEPTTHPHSPGTRGVPPRTYADLGPIPFKEFEQFAEGKA